MTQPFYPLHWVALACTTQNGSSSVFSGGFNYTRHRSMALASGFRRLRYHGRSPRRLPRSHLPVPHRWRSETMLSSIQTLATRRRSKPPPIIAGRQGGDPPFLAFHLHPIRFRDEARSPMRSKLLQLERRSFRHGLDSLLESDACQAPRLPRDHGSRDGVVREKLQEPEEALVRLL